MAEEFDNELEEVLSEPELPGDSEEPEEEAPEELPEDPETPEEDEGEPVEALTPREAALIEQFTESSSAPAYEFDPSTPPAVTFQPQEYRFIQENESIDDILADPNKFNAKIAELYNAALQRGAQLALEATYRGLPRTVSTYAKQQIDTMNLVNDFYQSNKDLIPLKPALARIAQKVGSEHPEYTLSQLLTESAKMARTVFKMKSAPAPKSSPAFVTPKGATNRVTRKASEKTLEDEIMELIS